MEQVIHSMFNDIVLVDNDNDNVSSSFQILKERIDKFGHLTIYKKVEIKNNIRRYVLSGVIKLRNPLYIKGVGLTRYKKIKIEEPLDTCNLDNMKIQLIKDMTNWIDTVICLK